MTYLDFRCTTTKQVTAKGNINKIMENFARRRTAHEELPTQDILKLLNNIFDFAVDRAYPDGFSGIRGLSAADLGYKPSITVDGIAKIPPPLVALTSKKTQSEALQVFQAIDPYLQKSMRADGYLLLINSLCSMVRATPKDLEEALDSIGTKDFFTGGPTE